MSIKITLASLALLTSVPIASAVPLVDQSNVPDPVAIQSQGFGELSDGRMFYAMQSFTVGVAGQLTSVDVMVGRENRPTVDLKFEIVPDANPLGVALATVSKSFTDFQSFGASFRSFDVSNSNIFVSPGQKYWIRLSTFTDTIPASRIMYSIPTNFNGSGLIGSGYSGGEARVWLGSDFVNRFGMDYFFRTYVDSSAAPPSSPVSEPATAIMMLSGLGMAAAYSRRRNRPA